MGPGTRMIVLAKPEAISPPQVGGNAEGGEGTKWMKVWKIGDEVKR